ncbi:MAG: hypothetical protein HY454_01185 [Parcubacteria group bacterium]|nr:hypothetical protein [Parcubacteria group bacterium]
MFKVSIFTRLLRQECGWDGAWAEKLTRHLSRLGYGVRHTESDACELVAEKELKTYHDPMFWLQDLPEELEQFEPKQIIRRIEVRTDTPVVSGGTCHGIPKPSGDGYYRFSIGCCGQSGNSVAYLEVEDAEDFLAAFRLFQNQVSMFTLMAWIFRQAEQAQRLISENHEYAGANRILDEIRSKASSWVSVLLR